MADIGTVYQVSITLGTLAGLVPAMLALSGAYNVISEYDYSIYYAYMAVVILISSITGGVTAYIVTDPSIEPFRLVVAQLWYMMYTLNISLMLSVSSIPDIRDAVAYGSIGIATISTGVVLPSLFGAPMVEWILSYPAFLGLPGGTAFFSLVTTISILGWVVAIILHRQYGEFANIVSPEVRHQKRMETEM